MLLWYQVSNLGDTACFSTWVEGGAALCRGGGLFQLHLAASFPLCLEKDPIPGGRRMYFSPSLSLLFGQCLVS